MMEWFESLTTLQMVFLVMGGLSSLIFIVQLIMMMAGGDADIDGDVDLSGSADLDFDGDPGTDVDSMHADADAAMQIFSVQGTLAFFMMLGWVGLAMNLGSGFGTGVSIGVGVAAGLLANFVMAKAFQAMKNLQSSGTMDLRNAVGQEGNVYLTIKADEPGKIQVAVQEHLKVFEAVSDDGSEIPTDTRVVVVRLVKGNTMVVKRVVTPKETRGEE